MGEAREIVVDMGTAMWQDIREWKMPVLLFVDDAVLLGESEWKLQQLVKLFGAV